MDEIVRTRKDLGKHITYLFEFVGLTRQNFDAALKITSAPVVTKILKGEQDYYSDYLKKIAFLFGMQLHELTNRNITLPNNFREILIAFHRFINSDAFLTLNQKPEYKYAVSRILQTDTLNNWVQTGEIANAIKTEIGHEYKVSLLSTALSSFSDLIEIRPSVGNTGHNQYRLKKLFNATTLSKPYIPTYIKLSQIFEKSIQFSTIFIMSEVLNILNSRSLDEKGILRSFDGLVFNKNNVDTYITPLVSYDLIVATDKAKNIKSFYSITDKGKEIMNIK